LIAIPDEVPSSKPSAAAPQEPYNPQRAALDLAVRRLDEA
jgi:hypothetical protein